MLGGINVPQFLDACAVNLRLAVARQVELTDDLLGQMPAHALGEEGVFGVEFEARLIIGLVRTVARHAHVAGRDALHPAILMEQDFGRRETREDFDPQFLGLAGQPATQITQLPV